MNVPKQHEEITMQEVTAYLNFPGSCRQAMSFYQKCLGAELQISPFPDAEGKPLPDPEAQVMHSSLLRKGQSFLMASDCPPGQTLRPGNNISVCIQCDSITEIDQIFGALGQNGEIRMPLADMFWGARFGMLADQFGIQWLLNCNLPAGGSSK